MTTLTKARNGRMARPRDHSIPVHTLTQGFLHRLTLNAALQLRCKVVSVDGFRLTSAILINPDTHGLRIAI